MEEPTQCGRKTLQVINFLPWLSYVDRRPQQFHKELSQQPTQAPNGSYRHLLLLSSFHSFSPHYPHVRSYQPLFSQLQPQAPLFSLVQISSRTLFSTQVPPISKWQLKTLNWKAHTPFMCTCKQTEIQVSGKLNSIQQSWLIMFIASHRAFWKRNTSLFNIG